MNKKTIASSSVLWCAVLCVMYTQFIITPEWEREKWPQNCNRNKRIPKNILSLNEFQLDFEYKRHAIKKGTANRAQVCFANGERPPAHDWPRYNLLLKRPSLF